MSSRLIFGSCSSQHYPEQPLWPVIQQRNATAFVWGGDAVYADDRVSWKGLRRKRLDPTPEYLRTLFQDQRNQPEYKTLLETNISIFGTIDDHDGSTNNGDQTFAWRKENTMEFVRFLGLSEDSPMMRRAEKGQGVYGVQLYDFDRPLGSRLVSDEEAGLDPDVVGDVASDAFTDDGSIPPKKNKRVAVFVLDIRSNRTPWRTSIPGRFQIDTDGDFLGDEQWTWFETAIGRSTAAVNVIVTGLQVHSERFYDANVIENWSGFQRAQYRLYQALLQPNVQAPILISGDVHHAQVMRKDCRRKHLDDTSTERTITNNIRPLYEITTSGMTHSWGTNVCGRANGNPFCHLTYFRTIFRSLLHFAHSISPWTEVLIDETNGKLQYSLELNVAELDFDWDLQTVSARILGVKNDDRVLLHQEWSLEELTNVVGKGTRVTMEDFDRAQQKLVGASLITPQEGVNGEEEWVCVHYRGLPNRIQFAFGALVPLVLLLILSTLPMWLSMILCGRFIAFLRRRFFVTHDDREDDLQKKTK
jgi:hypothetical protein